MPAAGGMGGGHGGNQGITFKDGVPIRYAVPLRACFFQAFGLTVLFILMTIWISTQIKGFPTIFLFLFFFLIFIAFYQPIRLLFFESRKHWLKQHGRSISATVRAVHAWPIFIVYPKGNHCFLEAEGVNPVDQSKYIFLSEGFYYDPLKNAQVGERVSVLIDEKQPKKYWVDISPWNTKKR